VEVRGIAVVEWRKKLAFYEVLIDALAKSFYVCCMNKKLAVALSV
jgi:hypothetical protein